MSFWNLSGWIALSTLGTTGAWNQYPDNPWRLDPRPRSEKLAIEARQVKQSYFSLSRQNGRRVTKAHSGNHVTVCASERLFTPTCKPVSNVTITTSTILRADSVGAARKVSPNWSQEIMTCHSSNCFSIVWGQRNAPLVTFPSSCYVTPRKAWQEPMENDKSLSVIYAIHMKLNWQPSKPSLFFD